MSISADIKVACLYWLRFGKQMPHVVTELQIGMHRADVAAVNHATFVEVEIKVSMSDLRRDFESKAWKHQRYSGPPHSSRITPNRVYFAVPERLALEAATVLAEKAPSYGLLAVGDETGQGLPWHALSVRRSAKLLHAEKPTAALFLDFAKRMSSDLAHFYMAHATQATMLERMTDLSRAAAGKDQLRPDDVEDILAGGKL